MLQGILFERAKIADWQADGDQRQVRVRWEDVGESVSCKMMLGGWLIDGVEPLKISVIHATLYRKESLGKGMKDFCERGIKSVRTDDNPRRCFTGPVWFTPADARHAPILPEQLPDVGTQAYFDVWFTFYALIENPVQRDPPFAEEETQVFFSRLHRFTDHMPVDVIPHDSHRRSSGLDLVKYAHFFKNP